MREKNLAHSDFRKKKKKQKLRKDKNVLVAKLILVPILNAGI